MDEVKILYETQDLAVCLKPAGVLSQTGKPGQASMVSLLEEQLHTPVFPVHRLDREAAGVMVYAKNEAMAAQLSRQIQQGGFTKEYLAVVRGCPNQDQGLWTDLLYHDQKRNKTFVVDRKRKGVREARLVYRCLERTEDCTLVQVHLLTGRTHQIRVQFASRGMPLVGDGRYGGGSGALGLWSLRLGFRLPETGSLCFASLPEALGPFGNLEVPEPLQPNNFMVL